MICFLSACSNNTENNHKGLRPETREDFVRYYEYTASGTFCEEYYIQDIIKNLDLSPSSYTEQVTIAKNLIEYFEYSKSTIHTPPTLFP